MRGGVAALVLCLSVAGGCRAEVAEVATTESSTSETPSDLPPESTCGDGIVDEGDSCEPGGIVPCNEDCTLPAQGAGSLEWTYVGDGLGEVTAVGVGPDGSATVGGVLRSPLPITDPDWVRPGWIARFAPGGTLTWEVVEAGPDDVGISVDAIRTTDEGQTVVSGGVDLWHLRAWVAAYDDQGVQLWTWTDTPPEGLQSVANNLALLDERIYATLRRFDTDDIDQVGLARLDSGGALVDSHDWPPGTDLWIRSLASDPVHEQLVAVGHSPVDFFINPTTNWIEALDLEGQSLWTAHESAVDPLVGGSAGVRDVAIDAEGGIYVSGYEDDDADVFVRYVRKLDSSGDSVWTRMLSAGTLQLATHDGVVYAASSSYSASLTIQALDASTGALSWHRQLAVEGEAKVRIADMGVDADALWLVGEWWPSDSDESLDEGWPWVARFRRE